jgi:hypothetical protein
VRNVFDASNVATLHATIWIVEIWLLLIFGLCDIAYLAFITDFNDEFLGVTLTINLIAAIILIFLIGSIVRWNIELRTWILEVALVVQVLHAREVYHLHFKQLVHLLVIHLPLRLGCVPDASSIPFVLVIIAIPL